MGTFVAGAVVDGGSRNEPLMGRNFFHLVNNAGFGGNDEALAGALLDVVEQGCSRTNVASMA